MCTLDGVTRHRRAAVAVWVAAFVLALLTMDAVDTAYVALRPFGNLPLAWVAVWGLAILGVLLWVPSRRGLLVGGVPFLALALFTGYAAWFSALFGESDEVLVRRLGAGDYEVRLVNVARGIDRIWEIRVRTREGLLSREWDVWGDVGFLDEEPLVTVTGPRSLDVRDAKGVVHHVTF